MVRFASGVLNRSIGCNESKRFAAPDRTGWGVGHNRHVVSSLRPSSQEVIDLLFSAIRHQATEGKIRAAAVCYDARVVPPGSSEKVDAICVELEHPSEGCAKVFLPYRKSRLRPIKYGDLFGVELSPRVFTMSGPG